MSQQPKVGQVIQYPEHRGFEAGSAIVSHVGEGKHMGRTFWWVTVKRSSRSLKQAPFTFAYGRR